jgi:hypothetical protein
MAWYLVKHKGKFTLPSPLIHKLERSAKITYIPFVTHCNTGTVFAQFKYTRSPRPPPFSSSSSSSSGHKVRPINDLFLPQD